MVKQAIQTVPAFQFEGCEMTRQGPSYMIESLMALRAEKSDTIALLIGMDSFNQFDQWHQWQSILEHCHLVVTPRPTDKLALSPALDAVYQDSVISEARELTNKSSGSIYMHDNQMPIDVSATQIRAACANERQTPRFLLTETVWQYIEDNGLYQ